MRIFQIILMAFVVATCYINVGKSTLDDGECLHCCFKSFDNITHVVG